MIFKVFFLVRD